MMLIYLAGTETFGDDGKQLEGDGTDLTISTSNDIH